ncbi:hypothetical protein CRUP_021200 [Coryphaenoides rupestris]|nr:hypothetical protein CRUP_021200 [Coryphaenoides rupestris]
MWEARDVLVNVLDVNDRTPTFPNAFEGPFEDSDLLVITVLDENDNRPIFSRSSYRGEIMENAPAGSTVTVLNGPVLAEDKDIGPNAVGARLDREAYMEPRVELFLLAVDVGGLNSSVPLSVTILDQNDNPPVFNPASYTVRLPENSPTGVVVTQLSASDADAGSNGWLTYRLESGAQDRFVVDPVSGAVLVGNATLDREDRSSYRLVVVATDRGTPPLSGTATLTVLLDDVNDSRPRFDVPVTTINVNESTPTGVVVVTLTATDPDPRPRLEYYIISVEATDDGNNPVDGLQDSFGIEFHTGAVYVRKPLNREQVATFEIIVSVHDNASDVIDQSVSVPNDVFSLNVDTGLVDLLRLAGVLRGTTTADGERPPGLEVGRVIATDVDDGVNGEVRYAFLQTGAGNRDWENFYIDALSGVITTAVRLDREKQATQSVSRPATHPGGPTTRASRCPTRPRSPLQVTLLDIDDNEPVFLKPPVLFVQEHAKPGTVVGNVTGAVDADEGSNAVVYYFIAGGNSEGNFELNRTGVLTVKKDLDRERDSRVHHHRQGLQQQELDAGPGPEGSWARALDPGRDPTLQEVNIYLEDINDQSPRFLKKEYTAGVAADAKVGSELIKVTAVDNDIGNNSVIIYLIVTIQYIRLQSNETEDMGDIFIIDNTGTIRTYDLFTAYDPGYFQLEVLASDEGGNSGMATVGIYILRNDQRVKIVINDIPENVRLYQDEFINLLSNITGAIVNVDDLQFHVNKNGAVNFAQTDVLIHVVNKQTNRILDVDRVIQMIDENKEQLRNLFRTYNILDVQPAVSGKVPDDFSTLQGTFGREPQAKPEDDRYLRAAIQEYDNIAKLGQIMRDGPIKGSLLKVVLDDYLRLKKLFAARMVTKSTSQGDHSSVTERVPPSSASRLDAMRLQ